MAAGRTTESRTASTAARLLLSVPQVGLREQLELLKGHNIAVQEARRKLHHEVQELKGSIRVLGRVRPTAPGESGESAVEVIAKLPLRPHASATRQYGRRFTVPAGLA